MTKYQKKDFMILPEKRLYDISQKVNISLNDLLNISQIFPKPVFTKNEIKINDTLLEQVINEALKFGLDINSYLEHLIIQDLKK